MAKMAKLPKNIKQALAAHKRWNDSAGVHGRHFRIVDHGLNALAGLNMKGADLRAADLRYANLTDTILAGADLTNATLRGAIMTCAALSDACCRFVTFTDADLTETDFRGADLWGAVFLDAVLDDAYFRGANLGSLPPLYADTARSYVLYVINEARGGPRYIAGCRNFSYQEAIKHWTGEQPAYVKAIKAHHKAWAARSK